MKPQPLLTTAQAGERIQRTARRVIQLCAAGILRHQRALGGGKRRAYLIRENDLAAIAPLLPPRRKR